MAQLVVEVLVRRPRCGFAVALVYGASEGGEGLIEKMLFNIRGRGKVLPVNSL
ncbi:hypothetical protein [Prevotella heparinolytica]|uniref:hypothetical protein n=1 Tax=Prevotella heparinolytica TaxID=28113 RepID=UPI001F21DF6E|nr:hypothetical protein [Bacteroides heparinolyticus]